MCRILTVLTPVLGLVLALTDVALAERPNVIVIMTDDQGCSDVACHGNPVIKNPCIDRLHAESRRVITRSFHCNFAGRKN